MKEPALILAVDDEPKNLRLLQAYLEPFYNVLSASSAKEAEALLKSHAVDLMLLDVMMPEIDGFDFTKRLRSAAATRTLPIVLLTSLRETEDRVRGIEAGCDDFISKPFDKAELMARIKTLLRLSHFRNLLDEKEKFETVFRNTSEGLCLLDTNLQLTQANEQAQAWLSLGGTRASVRTDAMERLLEGFRVRHEGDVRKDVFEKDFTFDLERPETELARPLILETRSSRIRNALGEITGIALMLRDVTLEREKNFAQMRFLDTLSHKLRTPVTVIFGFLGLLRGGFFGALSAEQREGLERIWPRFYEIMDTFDKQLSFIDLNLPSGAVPAATRESPEFQILLPSLQANLKERFPGRTIDISPPTDPGPFHIAMNKEHFEIALKNLLENAVKFNASEPAKIRVELKAADGTLALSVCDNGDGIPPEETGRIFDRFYQIDKWRTGNVGGLGLGLTLVKSIVQKYGGSVRVDSKLGEGSTFTLTLPQAL